MNNPSQIHQKSIKSIQNPSKIYKHRERCQKGPKMEPKGSQNRPKATKMEPKGAKREPKSDQNASKNRCPEKVAKKEAQGGYRHLFWDPFWVHFPSKSRSKIGAKIDAEKNMKFHEQIIQKGSQNRYQKYKKQTKNCIKKETIKKSK